MQLNFHTIPEVWRHTSAWPHLSKSPLSQLGKSWALSKCWLVFQICWLYPAWEGPALSREKFCMTQGLGIKPRPFLENVPLCSWRSCLACFAQIFALAGLNRPPPCLQGLLEHKKNNTCSKQFITCCLSASSELNLCSHQLANTRKCWASLQPS